jgi:hypothetical protein
LSIEAYDCLVVCLCLFLAAIFEWNIILHVILMAKKRTIKLSPGGWWNSDPQKAHLGKKTFSMITIMYGENRFRYLTAGDKNRKILLIIRIISFIDFNDFYSLLMLKLRSGKS